MESSGQQWDYDKRGYSYETIEEPLEDCMCKLCELLVRNAHQAECCGRIFCEYCLEQYKKTVLIYKCPNCRSPLKGKHFRDTRTDRAVQLTVIYCTNRAEGCEWQGELGQLDSHITSDCGEAEIKCTACDRVIKRKHCDNHLKHHCLKRSFPCPHCKMEGSFDSITTDHLQVCHKAPLQCFVEDCKQIIKRCDMNYHLEVCPKLMVQCPNQAQGCIAMCKREDLNQHCQVCPKRHHTCPHCGLRGTYDFIITQHTEECQEIQVPCQNQCCKEKFRRREIDKHQQVCPKKIIQCPYSGIGCTAIIKKEELEKHEDKVMKHHFKLALHRIQMLENNSQPKVVKLHGFSELKQNETNWLSDGFYSSSSGYNARLNVYPSGKGINDDIVEWPFRGEVTIELLNQSSDTNHKTLKKVFDEQTPDQVKNRKYSLDTAGCGSHTFLTFEELENPVYYDTQYLMNDTLFFRVTINPVSQTKNWLACEQ